MTADKAFGGSRLRKGFTKRQLAVRRALRSGAAAASSQAFQEAADQPFDYEPSGWDYGEQSSPDSAPSQDPSGAQT
eukprot:1581501-Amphidinium_carterae.1